MKLKTKAEIKLEPLLTNEFLKTLQLAVKTCGWSVNHIESVAFVQWCFKLAEKEIPDTKPYK